MLAAPSSPKPSNVSRSASAAPKRTDAPVATGTRFVSIPTADQEGLLNMRTGAGVKFPVVAKLKHEQAVTLLGVEQKAGEAVWVKIQCDAGVGWVNQAFLIGAERDTASEKEAEDAARRAIEVMRGRVAGGS